MLPINFEKMVQFGAFLRCISIKFQGKNSLKISVFIATTTKKAMSSLGEGLLVRGHAPRNLFKKWCNFGAF